MTTVARPLWLHPLVEWAFYVFALSIPLEYPDRSIPLEVHTITAVAFLAIALLQPRVTLRRPPAAFWWLVAYLWIYCMWALFTTHVGEAFWSLAQYAIVAMVFWVSCSVMTDARVLRNALLAFVAGCVVVATLNDLGIATKNVGEAFEIRRVVFGQNANLLGDNMALAIVILTGLAIGVRQATIRVRYIAVPAMLVGYSLLLSGSRGAMIALAGGLLAMATRTESLRVFVRTTGIVALAGVVAAGAVLSLPGARTRYGKILTGSMSGREVVYPIAWQMFLDRPVLGWGPVDNNYELGWRTVDFEFGAHTASGLPRESRDFHNLFFDTVTGTGTVGLIPLAICLALGLRYAWKARRRGEGSLPLALVVTLLLASMSGNWSANKQTWMFMGYAVASARGLDVRRVPQKPRQRPERRVA